MNDITLNCAGIFKSFGLVQAVKGVDLTVREGEFFSLLGPSGSGKTTLLRIIAGLETPDRGRVEIGGLDVTQHPPYARGLGMVFQDFLLFPHKTVSENVTFPLKMQRCSKSKMAEQLSWVLGLVRLEGYEDRYPHQLSAGQKQRIALARGLVARPKVLLLDEPLANLDRELRKEMEVELRRFQSDLSLPFVYVTHNQEEAITMSDRVAVMNNGGFEQVGDKLGVYARPATRFVASFVGSSNRIEGHVINSDEKVVRVDWNGIEVIAPRPEKYSEDKPVVYFLKYERITIGQPGDASGDRPNMNRIAGTLRDTIFKGQVVDHFAVLPNGAELVASRRTAGHREIRRGDLVELSWAAEEGDAFLLED
jgi:putative spermidine/putrescine transport system ATP-binding protein/spermidine/putrescine transport system ATP-binding protein